MSDNRIQSLSISSEGPRQTPNDSFGRTLATTLAKGTAGAMGLASPLLGAVSPMLSAPVSQAAAAIGQLANQSRAQVQAGTLGASANFVTGSVAGTSSAGASSGGPMSAVTGGADPSDPMAMLQAQSEMNNQYLMLQNQMQQQSREYEAMSNIMKVRHDTAKNAISNIH